MSNTNFNFSRPRRSGPPSVGGKIAASVFFLIFLAFGVGFTYLISADFLKAFAQRSWPLVDCVITRSKILDNRNASNPNYRLEVAYSYQFGAHSFTGKFVQRDYTGSNDYYKAQKLADSCPAGSHTVCRVDPAHPSDAFLQKSSLTSGSFILIPLIFVTIGGGGIILTWKRPSNAQTLGNDPATSPPVVKKSRVGGAVFASIFDVIGLLVLALWFIPTITRVIHARSWPRVPCTIVHSGVSHHSGNKGGTTYAVEVLYAYQFNGQQYSSSNYGFTNGSSSGYDAKADIVRSLPAHRKTVCYVDPNDPEFAVLDRDYSTTMLIGLIPLAFVLFGGIGMFVALRKPGKNATGDE